MINTENNINDMATELTNKILEIHLKLFQIRLSQ